MNNISAELHEKILIKEVTDSQVTNHPKALGLEWNSATDCMSPSIKQPEANAQTKRGIVSNVARTFDILGWISPSVLVMKLLYQQLWKLNIGWDDPVPEHITNIHSQWKEQLPLLAKRQLPRCYFHVDSQPLTQELHCFSDASQRACGAVIYIRSTYSDHPPRVSLVMLKTKVAKLPQEGKPATTIPLQELCGAVLLTQILLPVKAALNISDENIRCWTDSSIVLSWLDSQPKDYKPYVSNRISSILQVTSPGTWKHVPTAQNPADCASRGLMPKDLLNHGLWWSGPSWLSEEPIPVPKQPPRRPVFSPENRVSCNVLQLAPPPFLASRYSSYHKMLAITAWCLRFIHKIKHPHSSSVITGGRRLSTGQAEVRLAKLSQGRFFSKELHSLFLSQAVAPSSRLIALAPFVDDNQLPRVGGRLKKSSLSYSQSYPIILSSKDVFTKLMFNSVHECLGHCGPSLLLCHVGKRFHVLGARKLARTVCSQCTTCRRAAPQPQKQYMGDLPLERVNFTPPFTITGLDFAGPFTIKMGYTWKPVKLDAHICICVCFSTKAVHIKVISELTTKALLLGLSRFCDRRVCPRIIYSDNGSNFRGAQSHLRTLYKFLRAEVTTSEIHQHMLKNGVDWNTIPQRSPHFGGLWESAVKSMKHHLKRVIGSQVLSFEELQTVSCKVEACLNSRPLLSITSHNTDGLVSLTAGHFLSFRPPESFPHDPRLPEEPSLLKRWDMCLSIMHHFWIRWHQEYVQTLQGRTKWRKIQPNLQIGDIVILKEKWPKMLHWPLAKIVDVYPGEDGIVRVAKIQTEFGTYKRPTVKLALLTREEEDTPTEPALPPGVCPDTFSGHCPPAQNAELQQPDVTLS